MSLRERFRRLDRNPVAGFWLLPLVLILPLGQAAVTLWRGFDWIAFGQLCIFSVLLLASVLITARLWRDADRKLWTKNNAISRDSRPSR